MEKIRDAILSGADGAEVLVSETREVEPFDGLGGCSQPRALQRMVEVKPIVEKHHAGCGRIHGVGFWAKKSPQAGTCGGPTWRGNTVRHTFGDDERNGTQMTPGVKRGAERDSNARGLG